MLINFQPHILPTISASMNSISTRLAAITILLLYFPANAQTLPSATYQTWANANQSEDGSVIATDGGFSPSPGAFHAAANSTTATGSGSSYADVFVSPAPVPTISLSLVSISTGDMWATALGSSTMSYSLQITGADGFIPVQVNAAGSADVSVNINGTFEWESHWTNALAEFSVTDGASFSITHSIAADVINPTIEFEETGIYMMQTNLPYLVTLRATGAVSAKGTDTTSSVYIYIDPTFHIALPDSEAANYSLAFSDGIGNGSKVPDAGPSLFILATTLGATFFVRKRIRFCEKDSSGLTRSGR